VRTNRVNTAKSRSGKTSCPHARYTCSPRRLWYQSGAVALASLLLSRSVAHAQTDSWNGGNGNWDVASNWSLGLPNSQLDVVNDTSGTITYSGGTNVVNSFFNMSSGGFNLTGGTLTTNTFFTNGGLGMIAIGGGTLNVDGNFLNTNLGELNVSGGTFNVSGSLNDSGGGTLTFSGGTTTVTGNFSSADATNLTGGTLSGSGATTSNIAVSNTFTIQNATLTNFSVTNSSALQIQNGTLANVALDGGLTLTNGYTANIGNGVTFGSATPTTVDNGSTLFFNGTNNPTFNTELIFGSNGGTVQFDNLTLTLGSNALVHGTFGTLGDGNGDTLINQGTINADVSGGTLTIDSAKFTNNGTLQAANGGELYIASSWTNSGTITVDSTSSIVLTGTLSGTLNNSSALQIQNGTLTNVTLDGGLTLANGSTAYIGNGVTFGSATPTTIDNYSTLDFNGTNNPTFNTELTFVSNGGTVQFDNLTLTLGSNALVQGNGTLGDGNGDTLINQGTIAADVSGNSPSYGNLYVFSNKFINNGNLTANSGDLFIYSSALTNTGNLTAEDGGSLYIDATNWTNTGTLATYSGGTIYLDGTFHNAGSTFDALNTVGGTANAILIGTLTGGNLLNSSALNVQNGTLTNITLDGGVSITNTDAAFIGNGVTFGSATPTIIDNVSTIFFNGTNNPTFNTELIFGSNGGTVQFDNLTLTLGSNALVHGTFGTLGDGNGDTLINQGTIIADVSGGTLTIDSANFTNNGTLEAQNGSIALDGTTVLAGGTLYVAAGNTVAATGSVTQTGGTTRVDGTLTTASTMQIQGGFFVGTGTITGNVNNTGGTVRPGDLLGTLTISGHYTQTSGGATEIDLGGTQQGVSYDLLAVTNTAALNGDLDVKLVDGFTPTVGEGFEFLTYGSRTGTYSTLVSLNSGYSYSVSYNDSTGIGTLTINSVLASVPETSTFFMAGLMLFAGGLFLRRREDRQLPQQNCQNKTML
jgi:hypothetical protein